MDQSRRHSAKELSGKIKDSEGAMRNHLIRLLLHKKESGPFVNELLQNDEVGS